MMIPTLGLVLTSTVLLGGGTAAVIARKNHHKQRRIELFGGAGDAMPARPIEAAREARHGN